MPPFGPVAGSVHGMRGVLGAAPGHEVYPRWLDEEKPIKLA